MEDDEPKTLQDLARAKYRYSQMPPTDAEVSDALKAAGIDPDDENERRRFLSLVAAHADQLHAEDVARIEAVYGYQPHLH